MINFLISVFVKDNENIGDTKVRARYGLLASIVGIVCNIVLFVFKFILGIISGSIAVSADAFNNLSDAGSAIVTFLGFKLASKPADKEHPFGHGRFEYLSGFVIALVILLVGIELIKSATQKIINPVALNFSWIVVFGLLASILIKLWLCYFHRKLGGKLASKTMEAGAADSLSDVLSTSVTLIAVVCARFTDLPIDGYMGIAVALMVLYTGYNIARDTLSPLLGRAPDEALVSEIRGRTLGYDGILGVHDIIVHDYGPGRIFASLHAEVPITKNIMDSHALIDRIEREISEALGIEVLIHMDPLDISCAKTNELRDMVLALVHETDENFGIHDFRIIESGENTNVIFDITAPIEDKRENKEIINLIAGKIREKDERYIPKITVDRIY